jgi:hypothetical protein
MGVAALLFQVDALFVRQAGAPQNPPGTPAAVVSLGPDDRASQVIRVDAADLSSISLFPVPEATRADARVALEVWELPEAFFWTGGGQGTLVYRLERGGDALAAAPEFRLDIPRRAESRARFFRLDVHNVSPGPEARVALRANGERGHPPGSLHVNGREQWGDLAFLTTAGRATASANLAHLVAERTGWRRTGWLVAGGLLALTAVLCLFLWGVAGESGGARVPRATLPGTTWSWSAIIVAAVVMGAGTLAARWSVVEEPVESGATDLVERFFDAEKRTTFASLREGFAVEAVTIGGVRRLSVLALPFSRLTWSIDVPADGAVLRTAVAFRPDAWTIEGDGAMFRVGVSDGSAYTESYRRYLMPYQQPEDRRWFDVAVDLGPWAGRRVALVFNTEPGELGNGVGDAAIWGRPRVVPGASIAAGPVR